MPQNYNYLEYPQKNKRAKSSSKVHPVLSTTVNRGGKNLDFIGVLDIYIIVSNQIPIERAGGGFIKKDLVES